MGVSAAVPAAAPAGCSRFVPVVAAGVQERERERVLLLVVAAE
jgi:hypothetical protein